MSRWGGARGQASLNLYLLATPKLRPLSLFFSQISWSPEAMARWPHPSTRPCGIVPFPCSTAKKGIETLILLWSHQFFCFTAVCDDEIVIAPFLELGVCFRPGSFLERRVEMAAVLHEKKDVDQIWPRQFHFCFFFLFFSTLNQMKKWRKGEGEG